MLKFEFRCLTLGLILYGYSYDQLKANESVCYPDCMAGYLICRDACIASFKKQKPRTLCVSACTKGLNQCLDLRGAKKGK
jgi:hypothetical protein